MIPQFLAHYKAETAFIAACGLITTGIGLMANQVTSPKVFAVMVFLADWHMVLTVEWWIRMILFGAISVVIWWLQRRKYRSDLLIQGLAWQKIVAEEAEKVRDLRGELKHTNILLAQALTRIDVLVGRQL